MQDKTWLSDFKPIKGRSQLPRTTQREFPVQDFPRGKNENRELSFTYTSNRKREFLPRDQLIVVYCSLFLHIKKEFHATFYL